MNKCQTYKEKEKVPGTFSWEKDDQGFCGFSYSFKDTWKFDPESHSPCNLDPESSAST